MKITAIAVCLLARSAGSLADEAQKKQLRGRGAVEQPILGNVHLNGNGNGNGNRRLTKKLSGKCTVLEWDVQCEGGPCEDEDDKKGGKPKRHFACETSDGAIYDVDLDPANQTQVVSGETEFEGDADIDEGKAKMIINKGRLKKKEKAKRNGRNLLIGQRTVLAVNVVSGDVPAQTTTFDEASLSDNVFGSLVGGSDQVNLASQYTACSHGQLNFKPATAKASLNSAIASNITNGVTTVTVATTVAEGDGVMRNAVNAALGTAFGQSASTLANYVMHCLPAAAMSGIAYAYINSWNSVYSDKWCIYTSTQLHELGHNINLAHAGEGTAQYDDRSGFMGYSYSQDDQRMCFNGAKNWQLGWFSDRHVDLSASGGAYIGRLYGPTMYSTTGSSDKMIVRISDSSCASCDIYVSFNHRDSVINSQTNEAPNRVLVHTKTSGQNSYGQSWLLAKLTTGESYSTANVSSKPRAITVNSIDATNGFAEVIIGCTTDAHCEDGNLCTTNTCDTNTNECNAPEDIVCPNDEFFCNGFDVCNPVTGSCDTQDPTTFCDDGNPCTEDQCSETEPDGCLHTPIPNCLAPGALLETWTGISGTAISALTGIQNYPDSPNQFEALTNGVEAPTNYMDNFGSRLRTYIIAPETADYTFWIASDDAGELYLNSDDTNPAGATKIAEVAGWAGSRDWDKFAGQESAPIPLVQGQQYYLEALYKEGGGGDNLSVAWAYGATARTLITGQHIVYPAAMLGITSSPTVSPGTSSPTSSPTTSPTSSPTKNPTSNPTVGPTANPTSNPTASPTNSPTTSPTNSFAPTASPSKLPTGSPTVSPTKSPTVSPTKAPTASPTVSPTKSPTGSPTKSPTQVPTGSPTVSPTKAPVPPTPSPTNAPTNAPTKAPTNAPTASPTKSPTASPTTSPTKAPTPPCTPCNTITTNSGGIPNSCQNTPGCRWKGGSCSGTCTAGGAAEGGAAAADLEFCVERNGNCSSHGDCCGGSVCKGNGRCS